MLQLCRLKQKLIVVPSQSRTPISIPGPLLYCCTVCMCWCHSKEHSATKATPFRFPLRQGL